MIPKIVWGANTLNFGLPLDSPIAYSQPREGTEFVKSPAGVEDAWVPGGAHDQILEGDVRWIPGTDSSVTGVAATGWDGATGWRAFLQYAREKNTFAFYPDKDAGTNYTCYLVEPMRGAPTPEEDGTRSFRIMIRTSDDTVITGY